MKLPKDYGLYLVNKMQDKDNDGMLLVKHTHNLCDDRIENMYVYLTEQDRSRHIQSLKQKGWRVSCTAHEVLYYDPALLQKVVESSWESILTATAVQSVYFPTAILYYENASGYWHEFYQLKGVECNE